MASGRFLFSVLAASVAVGYAVRGRSRVVESTPTPPTPSSGKPGAAPAKGRWSDVVKKAGSAGMAKIVSTNVKPPTLEEWARMMAPACKAAGCPVPYAVKWLDMESGGNPCAIGYPPAKGPDGNPREMGIAQFYNPDDVKRFGLTGDELRAYCVPGDQHEIMWKGKRIKGFSGKLLRNLTPDEITRQADAAVKLIKRSMTSATSDLMGVHAGTAWSPRQANYWTLVKLQHGLPGVARSGMPAVTKFLGRAPSGWKEFRATLPKVKLDAGTEKWMKDNPGRIEAILDNAEECAHAFTTEDVA